MKIAKWHVAPFRFISAGALLRRVLLASVITGAIGLSAAAKEFKLPDQRIPGYAPSVEGSYLAGRIAGNHGQIAAARAYFDRALERQPDSAILVRNRLEIAVRGGNFDTALAFAEYALQQDKKLGSAHLIVGLDAFKAGQGAKALNHIQNYSAGRIGELTSGILNAWIHADAGDLDDAFSELDKLEAQPWAKSFVSYPRALLQMQSGAFSEAAETFKTADTHNRGNIRLLLNYAYTLEKGGDKEGAAQRVERLYAAVPFNPLIEEAYNSVRSGEPLSTNIATPRAGASAFLFSLGILLSRDRDYRNAVRFLRLAQMLEPDDDEIRLAIADIYAAEEKFNLANVILSEVSDQSRHKRRSELTISMNDSEAKKIDEARARLTNLLANDKSDVEIHLTLGQIMHSHKKYDEAIEHFNNALSVKFEGREPDWNLYYRRGMAYERAKKWPHAEKDFLKALELRTDQPLVLNYLGYTWVDMGLHLEKALKMIEKAVELRPRDGYITDSLGWAHYRLGNFEEAVVHLEKSVSLLPGDPIINDHLGDAYWQVGRTLEARFQWQHALDMDPEPEEIEKIEAKLINGLVETQADAAKVDANDG